MVFLAPLLGILLYFGPTLDTCAPGNAILTTLTNSPRPSAMAVTGILGFRGAAQAGYKRLLCERVVSGLERAKANGVRLGRKPVAPITVKQIHELRAKGLTQTAIAKKVGVSQAKVSQILKGV